MTDADDIPLAERVEQAWPLLQACFVNTADWRRFSAALLSLLRRLDEPGADRAVLQRQIAHLLSTAPQAQAMLHAFEPLLPALPVAAPKRVPTRPAGAGSGTRLQSPWATAEAEDPSDDPLLDLPAPVRPRHDAPREPLRAEPEFELEPPPPPRAPNKRRTLISVLYATDRETVEGADGSVDYSDVAADELSFGHATVSLPDDHKKGELERPRWYRLQFSAKPGRDVLITKRGALSREQFMAEAARARERDGSEAEALIFVHGYRVGFEDSILRTAQIAVDLEFRGQAITYSWPSRASWFGYGADANVSESSMFMLAKFITLARTELGLHRVHVVAHSMGSRVLARALNQHTLEEAPPNQAELNQVVFAAPDIDPQTFVRFAKVFAQSCERCTLYASKKDVALSVSRLIYGSRRGGDSSKAALVTRGVDTVDASKVDHSLLGHSYFSDRRTVLHDLHDLLERGLAPRDRFGLAEVEAGDGSYWEFEA